MKINHKRKFRQQKLKKNVLFRSSQSIDSMDQTLWDSLWSWWLLGVRQFIIYRSIHTLQNG